MVDGMNLFYCAARYHLPMDEMVKFAMANQAKYNIFYQNGNTCTDPFGALDKVQNLVNDFEATIVALIARRNIPYYEIAKKN